MNASEGPVVSIIVPARNEEACLATCLKSLIPQSGISFEIIVVDDASTDRTAEIAASFLTTNHGGAGLLARLDRADSREGTALAMPHDETNREGTALAMPQDTTPNREGTVSTVPESSHFDDRGFSPHVTVISAPPLPNDWTGKNNAMSAGAKIAKGNWLLFTDADTIHKPGSLARAVAEAEQHGAALLSYSPEQEVHSFWEKAVMSVIFAELAATYPPKKVNDPASPIAAANGQYLLISREAYDAVGGHTKIASDLLEDVAMARLVKSSGRKLFFRYGGDAVRTRMYRTWAQMKEGWTKNLALLFKNPGLTVVRYAVESFFLIAAVNGAIQVVLFGRPHIQSQSVLLPHYPISDQYFPLFRWLTTFSVVLLFVFLLLSSIGRVVKAHFPLRFFVFSICGVPLFAYLLLRSITARRNGTVSWKGRNYTSAPTRTTSNNSPHTSSAGAKCDSPAQ